MSLVAIGPDGGLYANKQVILPIPGFLDVPVGFGSMLFSVRPDHSKIPRVTRNSNPKPFSNPNGLHIVVSLPAFSGSYAARFVVRQTDKRFTADQDGLSAFTFRFSVHTFPYGASGDPNDAFQAAVSYSLYKGGVPYLNGVAQLEDDTVFDHAGGIVPAQDEFAIFSQIYALTKNVEITTKKVVAMENLVGLQEPLSEHINALTNRINDLEGSLAWLVKDHAELNHLVADLCEHIAGPSPEREEMIGRLQALLQQIQAGGR